MRQAGKSQLAITNLNALIASTYPYQQPRSLHSSSSAHALRIQSLHVRLQQYRTLCTDRCRICFQGFLAYATNHSSLVPSCPQQIPKHSLHCWFKVRIHYPQCLNGTEIFTLSSYKSIMYYNKIHVAAYNKHMQTGHIGFKSAQPHHMKSGSHIFSAPPCKQSCSIPRPFYFNSF